MKIYNTLTRRKEEFVPIEAGHVTMYVCGPTVYDKIHIGNARPVIVFDTVRNYLEYKGFKVKYIQNFTDVDDKIIARANAEGRTCRDITDEAISDFFAKLERLNIRRADSYPRVTEEIPEIIALIERIVANGYAYEKSGTVYFNTQKLEGYGGLSGKNMSELRAGARIAVADEKLDPADFVLWKPAKENEPFWESPWGNGRPGWHIECSAMVEKYLGKTIDIHAGGTDLVFPHHENELAQSTAANGVPLANYWMHNAMINIDNEKVSKSKGNFFKLNQIAEHYSFEVIRFFVISQHYSMPVNFSEEPLIAANNGLQRIKNAFDSLNGYASTAKGDEHKPEEAGLFELIPGFMKSFEEAMDDDLNTANAVTALYELVKFSNTNVNEKSSSALIDTVLSAFRDMCRILGISTERKAVTNETVINGLIEERNAARKNKDFKRSDEIRDELLGMGVTIKDTREGTMWSINEN